MAAQSRKPPGTMFDTGACKTWILRYRLCFPVVSDPGLGRRQRTRMSSYFWPISIKNKNETRMHSSRMRTVRCSGRMGEGVYARGCLPRGGMSAYKGCLPWGRLSAQTPPTPVNRIRQVKMGIRKTSVSTFSDLTLSVSLTKCPSWKGFIGCTPNHTEPPALSVKWSMSCSYFSRWSLSWDGQKRMRKRRATAGWDARLIGCCVILCVNARSANLSRR